MSSLSTPPPASPGPALDSSSASASASGDVTLQPDAESPPSRRRSTVAAAKKTPSSATAAAAAATTGQGAALGTRSKRGTSSTTEQEEATTAATTADADADAEAEATTPKVEDQEEASEPVAEGKADSGHSSSSATKAHSTRSSRGRQSASASSTSRSPPATAVSDKHRQRSVSTFKELASLGLRALGDGEEEPLLPRRSRRAAMSPARRMDGSESGDEERDEEDEDEDEDEEENARPAQGEGDADEGGEGETRCVCGSQDENVGLMIQCDSCKCWQHCICMGLHTEADCPDVYFCEQCRPELHIPLLRSLGVLPAARSHKKGATKQGSTNNAAAAAGLAAGAGKKELKEAKEAVLLLAADNERRRNAGQEPLTGWSVHQNPALVTGLHGAAHEATSPTVAHHRRQSSEARLRGARSQSRDEEAANGTRTTPGVGGRHASPKRRSTMNSRDSGWEPIPPGLLAEDWDKKDEEDERAARKRKRGRDDHSPARSISPPDRSTSNTTAADIKRRRVSAGISAHSPAAEERSRANGGRRATSPDAAAAPAPAPAKKAAWNKKKQPALDENGVPIVHAKHPNQYTYRNKEKPSAAAAAAAVAPAVVVPAAAGQTGSTDSPSPSPSKARLTEGGRKGGLRAADAGASRTGTPAPPNPGSAFGLPDHLAHLAPLLPAVLEPLTLHPPSATKAPPRTGAQARAAAASTSDDAGAGVSVEPLAYTTLSVSEARTKIRFPPKRMTMGEMRKRVRNIGEYISRSQIEAVERSRRMRLLGITVDIDEPRVRARGEEKDAQGDSEMKDATTTTAAAQLGSEEATQIASSSSSTLEVPNGSSSNGTSDAAPLVAPDAKSTTSTSNAPASPAQDNEGRDEISLTMRLVEELTKELASFTQRFGAAPGLPHGISA